MMKFNQLPYKGQPSNSSLLATTPRRFQSQTVATTTIIMLVSRPNKVQISNHFFAAPDLSLISYCSVLGAVDYLLAYIRDICRSCSLFFGAKKAAKSHLHSWHWLLRRS